MPLSALTPAPVNTTIRFLLLAFGAFIHVSKARMVSFRLTSFIGLCYLIKLSNVTNFNEKVTMLVPIRNAPSKDNVKGGVKYLEK
jgi:hypothetical protein